MDCMRPQNIDMDEEGSYIQFKDSEHMLFFNEQMKTTGSEDDTYRRAFFYTMGISPETRDHIKSLYDFKENTIKIDGLSESWQTSGTLKICRLALNLYNGFNYDGTDWDNLTIAADGKFTPYELFANGNALYMIEAVKIRYPQYTYLQTVNSKEENTMIITEKAQTMTSAAIIELIKSLENPKSGEDKDNAVDNALDALYLLDKTAWRKFMIAKAKDLAHELHSYEK